MPGRDVETLARMLLRSSFAERNGVVSPNGCWSFSDAVDERLHALDALHYQTLAGEFSSLPSLPPQRATAP